MNHDNTETPAMLAQGVRLDQLKPSPFQPKGRIKNADIDEIVQSMKTTGQLQPIIVRKVGKMYEIVAGHRRAEAARLLDWKTVAVVVRELDDTQAREAQLVENVVRSNLAPIDEAHALAELIERTSIEEVALSVGKPLAYVRRRVSLLEAPKNVIKALQAGDALASSVEFVMSIADDAMRKELFETMLRYDPPGATVTILRRELQRELDRNELRRAPFTIDDTSMPMPWAASCSVCPYRVVKGHDLFAEDNRFGRTEKNDPGRCARPSCLAEKTKIATGKLLESAVSEGFRPMKDAEVKHATRHGYFDADGFVRLDDRVPNDPKNRTWDKVLAASKVGGERVVALVDGRMVKLAPADVAKSAVKELDIKAAPASTNGDQASLRSQEAKKRALDRRVLLAILGDMDKVTAPKLDTERFLARGIMRHMRNDVARLVWQARALARGDVAAIAQAKKKSVSAGFDYAGKLRKELEDMKGSHGILALALQVLTTPAYGVTGAELDDAIATFKIDHKGVRKSIIEQAKTRGAKTAKRAKKSTKAKA